MQDEDESRDKQKLHLTDKAEWQYSDREKENLEVISNKIIGKSIPLISGVLHTHVARQPDRVHVRQVRAERAVHDPAQPRQRRRPWADEQLLPRAGQQVGMAVVSLNQLHIIALFFALVSLIVQLD